MFRICKHDDDSPPPYISWMKVSALLSGIAAVCLRGVLPIPEFAPIMDANNQPCLSILNAAEPACCVHTCAEQGWMLIGCYHVAHLCQEAPAFILVYSGFSFPLICHPVFTAEWEKKKKIIHPPPSGFTCSSYRLAGLSCRCSPEPCWVEAPLGTCRWMNLHPEKRRNRLYGRFFSACDGAAAS